VPSTAEWRELVDAAYPDGDTGLRGYAAGYRYISIDNTGQDLDATIAAIKTGIPEIYR
jgi:hypothetical protein